MARWDQRFLREHGVPLSIFGPPSRETYYETEQRYEEKDPALVVDLINAGYFDAALYLVSFLDRTLSYTAEPHKTIKKIISAARRASIPFLKQLLNIKQTSDHDSVSLFSVFLNAPPFYYTENPIVIAIHDQDITGA